MPYYRDCTQDMFGTGRSNNGHHFLGQGDHDHLAMRSLIDEGVRRGELTDYVPAGELALFINTQLYGLMVAWCMTDASVIGSEKTDEFYDNFLKPALMPYRKQVEQ